MNRSAPRHARKKDGNHDHIKDGLERCGYPVIDGFRLGDGWPDLYVKTKRPVMPAYWAWVEIKMPGEDMTPAEITWWKRYDGPGIITYSLEQTLAWLAKEDAR